MVFPRKSSGPKMGFFVLAAMLAGTTSLSGTTSETTLSASSERHLAEALQQETQDTADWTVDYDRTGALFRRWREDEIPCCFRGLSSCCRGSPTLAPSCVWYRHRRNPLQRGVAYSHERQRVDLQQRRETIHGPP